MTGTVLKLDDIDLVRNGRPLLSGVSLSVEPGQRWVLLGANGAGKSTLLSLCGAVRHPTRGTVEVLGNRLGRVDIRTLRGAIGHVDPRHPLRSSLTVEQVVWTGATGSIDLVPRWEPTSAQRERATELIALLGIEARRDAAWPTLSQGERGRALIARALLPDPALVLLDEPATGLDVAAREQLLETLDRVHQRRPQLASILVTHHIEEIPRSTSHAALIRDGRLSAAGPITETLTTPLVSAAFDHPITIHRRYGRWSAQTEPLITTG